MATPGAWREVRSTAPGLLNDVAGQTASPEGARRVEGGFSVVAGSAGRGIRKLPSLYVNDVQLFAAREMVSVQKALTRTVDAFVRSSERATYMLTACEIDGRAGLYGTDFFNRSAYRRRLERLGMRFSTDAFVVLRDDGTFESTDRAPFVPSFVTLGAPSEDLPGVDVVHGASLLYQLAFYRIADIGEEELGRLASLAGGFDALSAADPADLAGALLT